MDGPVNGSKPFHPPIPPLTPMRTDHFLFITAFTMDFCTALVSFAVPLVALSLGASIVELGLIGTTGTLAFTLACSFTGKLADRYDRRRLMGISSIATAIVFMSLIFASSFWELLIGATLGWGLMALFWPALQATLAEGRNRAQLVKSLGMFNMFWTIGFMCGPLFGGYLYAIHPRLTFTVGMAGMALLSLAIFFMRFKPADVQKEEPLPDTHKSGDTARFRTMAWIASFSAFFMVGILNNQFPKLAAELLIRPEVLGVLLAIPRFAQFLVFLLVRYTTRWQFRLMPLIIPQICAIIGMVTVTTQDTPMVLGLAFGTIGLLVGASFSASQFYSFFQEERKGERGARNEMIIGMGMVSGPFVGGLLAQNVGLRAPYVLCCVVLATAMLLEYRLYRKKVRNDEARSDTSGFQRPSYNNETPE